MLIEIVGWLGSIIYILSYFLLSYNVIQKEKFYYLLNILASFLIIVISMYKETYQSMIINLIWIYISYLGYINKDPQFKLLSKKIMNIISILFFVISFLVLLIADYTLSIEFLAWFSVFAFAGSYFLYSVERINERLFHFYNFLAASSLIPKMILFENYQVLTLEVLWAFFALSAYFKNKSNKDYLTVCS